MASGRWADSDRRDRLPPGWHRLRDRVLRRDHHHCRWGSLPDDRAPLGLCRTRAAEVDHIASSTDHAEHNLRSLCPHHHRVRSGRQGAARSAEVMRARRALRKRPEEPHPGGLA